MPRFSKHVACFSSVVVWSLWNGGHNREPEVTGAMAGPTNKPWSLPIDAASTGSPMFVWNERQSGGDPR